MASIVRKGSTLIEILVVIAVMALIIGLLMPAIQKMRESASQVRCINNLKQLGLAGHNAYDSYAVLPPANGHYPSAISTAEVAPVTVWILPYLDQGDLFEQIQANGGVQNPTTGFNYNGSSPVVPHVYLCNTDSTRPAAARTAGSTIESFGSYSSNGQVFGKIATIVTAGEPAVTAFDWQGSTTIEMISDGLSNTVFFTEKMSLCEGPVNGVGGSRWPANEYGPWMSVVGYVESTLNTLSPNIQAYIGRFNAVNCERGQPSTMHGVLPVCMGDGSVRLVGSGISQLTLNLAFVPNDGLMLGEDW